MRKTLYALIAVMTLATLCASPSAFAQSATATPEPDSAQFGMFVASDPADPYFKTEIASGGTVSLSAGISNTGASPLALRVFATNAFNPPNGGFAAGEEDDNRTGPALWINFAPASLELGPGEHQTIDFTITVPVDTPPGEYTAAIVTRTADALEVPGTVNFRQILRSALPVAITVPGPANPGFTLGNPAFSIEGDMVLLQIPLTNTGNRRLKPTGTVSITTPSGDETVSAQLEMESVFVGSETLVQLAMPNDLRAGEYLVSTNLTDVKTSVHETLVDSPVTLPDLDHP